MMHAALSSFLLLLRVAENANAFTTHPHAIVHHRSLPTFTSPTHFAFESTKKRSNGVGKKQTNQKAVKTVLSSVTDAYLLSLSSIAQTKSPTVSTTAQIKSPATSTNAQATSPIMAAYELDARGRELEERGALNAAVAAYTEAVSLHPTPDRYFRLGNALEENGEPISAIEVYEKARNSASADPIHRHDAALHLAHLWAHDLGDVAKGISHVDEAIAEEGYEHTEASDAAALDQKAFFLADEGRLVEAIALWDAALERSEGNAGDVSDDAKDVPDDARFYRAVAKALLGQYQEAEADFAVLPPKCQYMVDSWRYAASHYPQERLRVGGRQQGRLFSGTYTILEEALKTSRPDGLVCEFGVFHGKSIRLIASMVGPQVPVDGFDTFEGIPEAWGDEPAGTYTADAEIPERVPDNVRFHVGLFADTLPGYVASLQPPELLPVRLINVDCDLYQGTVEILHYLANRIGPGTIIVFDEYLMTPTWPEDEYKAFQEACVKFGWEYEYLSFSLFSKQVVVKITASNSFVGPMP